MSSDAVIGTGDTTATTDQLARTHPDSAAAVDRPAQADAIDRLIGQVLDRLRSVQTADGPGLETSFHAPGLGTIRLVVSGLPGEIVRATLIAASPETVQALRRAVAQHRATDGLAGIDLQVRQAGEFRRAVAEAAPDGRADGRSGTPDHSSPGNDGRHSDGRNTGAAPDFDPAPIARRARPIGPLAGRALADRLGRSVDRSA